MGEVVEVGAENKSLKVGDRIVVPFTISCGECFFCQRGFFSGVQRYLPKLLKLIEDDKIDPSVVITHRADLEAGPELYKTFRDKEDGCIKVVLKPT